MQKIYLSAIILLALNTLNIKIVHAKTPKDSIGVENVDGLKVIIYKISVKETYYSIARRYNLSPKDLLNYNDSKFLNVGTIIKVPTKVSFNASDKSSANSNTTLDYFNYTIIAKDNLNLLAEKYGSTIPILKEMNGLTGSNLSIGQVIKIPLTDKAKELNAVPAVTKTSNVVEKRIEAPVEQKADLLTEHIVKPKEFLNKIAENYNTTVEEIKALNNLNSNNLRVGQKLKIPTSKNADPVSTVNAPKPETIPTEVAKEINGQHKVSTGEDIFTLAKKFGVTAYQIRKTNNLDDNNLKVGQIIKIPSNTTVAVAVEVPIENQGTAAKPIEPPKESTFEYIVVGGDDIYSIAKKFELTTYQIKAANNLKSATLSVGQKIIIPKPPEPQSVNQASIEEQREHPDSLTLKDPKLRRDPSVYGLSQVQEKGTGIWISDKDLDDTKMLVLHRTAPIGTVIKITNPMTNISTFAKVVGKFTENDSTKDVIIVMTKAVAESLGALDKRFLCNIMYAQ